MRKDKATTNAGGCLRIIAILVTGYLAVATLLFGFGGAIGKLYYHDNTSTVRDTLRVSEIQLYYPPDSPNSWLVRGDLLRDSTRHLRVNIVKAKEDRLIGAGLINQKLRVGDRLPVQYTTAGNSGFVRIDETDDTDWPIHYFLLLGLTGLGLLQIAIKIAASAKSVGKDESDGAKQSAGRAYKYVRLLVLVASAVLLAIGVIRFLNKSKDTERLPVIQHTLLQLSPPLEASDSRSSITVYGRLIGESKQRKLVLGREEVRALTRVKVSLKDRIRRKKPLPVLYYPETGKIAYHPIDERLPDGRPEHVAAHHRISLRYIAIATLGLLLWGWSRPGKEVVP